MKALPLLLILVFYSAHAVVCIEPNNEEITLSGYVERVTFPGRPNYESIEDGDEPETAWIITTDTPICIKGLKRHQNTFHLFWINNKHITKPGKYTISGKTMEAHTVHHHTPVLIEVDHATRLYKTQTLQAPGQPFLPPGMSKGDIPEDLPDL